MLWQGMLQSIDKMVSQYDESHQFQRPLKNYLKSPFIS